MTSKCQAIVVSSLLSCRMLKESLQMSGLCSNRWKSSAAVSTRLAHVSRQSSAKATDRILIQVPGIGSAAELEEIIGTTAQLTFSPVVRRTTITRKPRYWQQSVPSMDEPGCYYVIESAPVVTGEELVDAQPSFDQNGALL